MRYDPPRNFRRSRPIFCRPQPASWWTPARIAAVASAVAAAALGAALAWYGLAHPTVLQAARVQGTAVDISDPIEPELRQRLTAIALADVEELRNGDALML